MRIAMMADLYRPHLSGVTRHIDLCREGLAAAGHEVRIFTFGPADPGDPPGSVIRSPGFRIGLPYGDNRLHPGLRHTRAVLRELLCMDLVHVHHPFASGRIALRHCRPAGIPIVFTWHSRYTVRAALPLPQFAAALIDRILERRLLSLCRNCNAVVVPARWQLVRLGNLGVQRLHHIPNGIPVQDFRRTHSPKSREVCKDLVAFVFLGRVAREKRLERVLKAVQMLVPQIRSQCRLHIVGDGPARAELVQQANRLQISDHVRFPGAVDASEVPATLAHFDVFVTASDSEVHPLAIMEALASGLPVLGPCDPAIEELVESGVNGVLVPETGFERELAGLMTRIIVDPGLRWRLAQGAAASASGFSLERTITLLAGLYASLLRDTAPPDRRTKAAIPRRVEGGLL